MNPPPSRIAQEYSERSDIEENFLMTSLILELETPEIRSTVALSRLFVLAVATFYPTVQAGGGHYRSPS